MYQIRPASYDDFTSFHSADYIDFLRNVNVQEEVTSFALAALQTVGMKTSMGACPVVCSGLVLAAVVPAQEHVHAFRPHCFCSCYALPAEESSPSGPWHLQGTLKTRKLFNCKEDCPVFDGIYQYCQVRTFEWHDQLKSNPSPAVLFKHGIPQQVSNSWVLNFEGDSAWGSSVGGASSPAAAHIWSSLLQSAEHH